MEINSVIFDLDGVPASTSVLLLVEAAIIQYSGKTERKDTIESTRYRATRWSFFIACHPLSSE